MSVCIRPQSYVDWQGRMGLLVRNSRTMTVVYWVNVSESAGAGSARLGSARLTHVDQRLLIELN